MNTYQEVILADGTVVKENIEKSSMMLVFSRKLLKYSTLMFLGVLVFSALGIQNGLIDALNGIAVLGMMVGLVLTFIMYSRYKKEQEAEQK